jgi:ArsR family metal-binding transcriptional regulator
MLIDDYEIELSTPACDLESAFYAAKVRLGSDISEVLPYVNAKVQKGEFIPGMPVLVWRKDGRRYALRPNELAISGLEDRDHANELVAATIEWINSVWEGRNNIEPSYATFEKPKVLNIYKLLPRTNCKECGAPTCMAFADLLAKDKKTLSECPALKGDECADKLSQLIDMGL